MDAAKLPHNSSGCDGLVITEFRKFINWPVRVKAEHTHRVAQKELKANGNICDGGVFSLITRVLLNVFNPGTLTYISESQTDFNGQHSRGIKMI